MVEAIEEGKIVKVPERYAKREGLVILKQATLPNYNNPSLTQSYHKKEEKALGKPIKNLVEKRPDWKEKQVLNELVENFHWVIRIERRKRGLTRKQFSRLLNESDDKLRVIEEGRLPEKDFVLINKIQTNLGINLRKDKRDYNLTTHEILSQGQKENIERLRKGKQPIQQKEKEDDSELVGQGIEILDDEI